MIYLRNHIEGRNPPNETERMLSNSVRVSIQISRRPKPERYYKAYSTLLPGALWIRAFDISQKLINNTLRPFGVLVLSYTCVNGFHNIRGFDSNAL